MIQETRRILREHAAIDLPPRTDRDLGAESIDFRDIVFGLERHFAIKIPQGELFSLTAPAPRWRLSPPDSAHPPSRQNRYFQ